MKQIKKNNNDELHSNDSSPSVTRIMKSRRIIWAGLVAHMGEKRDALSNLDIKTGGKEPLGKS
jgi:hypothetical protein